MICVCSKFWVWEISKNVHSDLNGYTPFFQLIKYVMLGNELRFKKICNKFDVLPMPCNRISSRMAPKTKLKTTHWHDISFSHHTESQWHSRCLSQWNSRCLSQWLSRCGCYGDQWCTRSLDTRITTSSTAWLCRAAIGWIWWGDWAILWWSTYSCN